ncbi:hypothetical protein [Kitasatospora sp. NBC_01302]|uniref:hypothetical protein n=1 Tax=Kitasatospora sp. NBC_01302 TaxID=2903575 RepID=UPI002E0E5DBD|nr:hypothetical protein OG294_14000 [Kitasatospora sp. NBC_01302]
MRTPAPIVRPGDTIDSDEWSIIANKRQLHAAFRAWLADYNPEFLDELEHAQLDEDRVYNGLPYAVDEIIDHIKEQQR